MVQLVLKKKFVGYFHFQSGNEQGDWILGVGVHVLNDWLLRLQPQLLSANDTAMTFCREKSSVLNLAELNFNSCVEPVAAFLSNALAQNLS